MRRAQTPTANAELEPEARAHPNMPVSHPASGGAV